MEFRDYAAKETAALFSRLLASQAEASVLHLRSLSEALDVASGESKRRRPAAAAANQDMQELIRRLNTPSNTAARATAQQPQKDTQAILDSVAQGDRKRNPPGARG